MHSVISFVGLPGGGKSTVGRQIAKRLSWAFVDSDAAIERRIGQSIRSFFDTEGEARFRDIEAEVIAELCGGDRMVLATGGGAVLRSETRDRLHAGTQVVYLRASPEELHRRLKHDTSRPLLQVSDPLGRFRELYAQRDPLYREVAHFVVDTGRPSVASLANMVLMQLELAGVLDPSSAPSSVRP